MSGKLLDNYPSGATIYALFDSFAGSTGASITLTGLAVTDIEIYKNGSTTQRSSDAGYALLDTDGIDFDSITGIHGISIDLSDNTDAGFYAVGSQYTVVISTVTIDSQTVSFILGSFRIVAAEHTAGYPVATIKDGTGTGELDTASGVVLAKDHTGANLATASALDTVDNFLDTEVQAIKDKTDLIPGTVDGKTFIAGWTLVMAALLGKASGLGTTTAVFRAVDDSKDRITATVDANGNRTALTLDAT